MYSLACVVVAQKMVFLVSSCMSRILQNSSMLVRLSKTSSGDWPVVSMLSTNVQSWIVGVANCTHWNSTKFIMYIAVTLRGSPSGKPVIDLRPGPAPPVITNLLSNAVIARIQGERISLGIRMRLAMAITGMRGNSCNTWQCHWCIHGWKCRHTTCAQSLLKLTTKCGLSLS